MGSPAKSRRKVVSKDQLPCKESIQLGCVSQDAHPRTSTAERGKSGIQSHRQILRGHVAPKKIEKERVLREALYKSAILTSAIRALPIFRKGHKTKPCLHGTWQKMSTSSKYG